MSKRLKNVGRRLKVAQLEEEIASTKVLMFSHKIDTVRNELKDGQQVMKEMLYAILDQIYQSFRHIPWRCKM